MGKSGVEHLAQHPGWRTKRKPRARTLYRYSDGNTYTDNLTLKRAREFRKMQNGGTITPMLRIPKPSELLRSAASALEHGRRATAERKLREFATRAGLVVRGADLVQPTAVETLDASDVATILVGLRMYQNEYGDWDSLQIADAWPMHFEVSGDAAEGTEVEIEPEPCGAEYVDKLCERINCARVLRIAGDQ